MTTKSQLKLDAKAFLSKRDGGRSTAAYRKDQVIFSQRESADPVFFIQREK